MDPIPDTSPQCVLWDLPLYDCVVGSTITGPREARAQTAYTVRAPGPTGYIYLISPKLFFCRL